jgi:hypothetical protein
MPAFMQVAAGRIRSSRLGPGGWECLSAPVEVSAAAKKKNDYEDDEERGGVHESFPIS